jgi:hypothetical protein
MRRLLAASLLWLLGCEGTITFGDPGDEPATADAAPGLAGDAAAVPTDGGGAADGDGAAAIDAPAAACRDFVDTFPSGHHNLGQACRGCHDGTGAPRFTASGTLFDASRTEVVSGATIRIVDANGKKVEVVTALNGNFWTQEPLAYPLTVEATACPDVVPMVAKVPAPGNCNAGGCHDDTNRIHLP